MNPRLGSMLLVWLASGCWFSTSVGAKKHQNNPVFGTLSNTKQKSPTKKRKKNTYKSFHASQEEASLRRIRKEYKEAIAHGMAYDWIRQEPVRSKKSGQQQQQQQQESSNSLIVLGPLSTNIRHWHFSFRGCGEFGSGIYHGRVLLPKDYPNSPPRVQLWTPSGRFRPGVDICLSASAYHPETWTPRWTLLALIQSLRLHMLTNAYEIGGMTSTLQERLDLAQESRTWSRSWMDGKRNKVTVDHKLLLEQNVLNVDDETDTTSASLSESRVQEKKQEGEEADATEGEIAEPQHSTPQESEIVGENEGSAE